MNAIRFVTDGMLILRADFPFFIIPLYNVNTHILSHFNAIKTFLKKKYINGA